MDLLPAVLIIGPQLSMVMEKQLTAEGVPTSQSTVVQGCQATAILVVRRSAQVQQGLRTRSLSTEPGLASSPYGAMQRPPWPGQPALTVKASAFRWRVAQCTAVSPSRVRKSR